jgi:hypothetical protein
VLEARGESAGERKSITVLFADMAGSTAMIHNRGPEEAHLLTTPVIELMMMEARAIREPHCSQKLGPAGIREP